MSITLKNLYAGAPNTERGRASVISVDEKTKSKLVYGCGTNVVIRDVKNPMKAELYTDHAHNVTAARISPSGSYCCSGDENGNVRIWATDNQDKTLKLEIRPISKSVRDVAWTPDNQRIVAVGEGKGLYGHVFLWDSGSPVGEISGHSSSILSADMRPQRPFRIATGGEDNSVNFFQGPPFKFSHSTKDHNRYVNCVRFSPDGNYFVSVASDKTGILFDGKAGTKIGALETEGGHTASIYSVAWSPDSKFFATAAADKSVKIWDASTRKAVNTIQFENDMNFMQVAVAWIDASTIVSLSLNGDLNYLDPNKPSAGPVKIVNGHNKKIYRVIYNPANNRLYTCGADGVAIRYDVGVGSAGRITGKGHTNAISAMALAGNELVTCSVDETLRFTPEAEFQYTGSEIKLDGVPCDISVSKNDSGLVVVSTHKTIVILKDKEVKKVVPVSFEPTSISLNSSDSEIAVGGADKKVRIYSFNASSLDVSETAVLAGNNAKITRVRYSPDSSLLAVGDSNREIVVYDAATRTEKYTGLVFHTSQITDFSWSPSGNYLASSAVDKSLIIWDLAAKKRCICDIAHLQGVNSVAFINENTVASVGGDFSLKVWEFKF